MRTMNRLSALALLLLFLAAGCKKKDLTPSAPPINIIVKMSYDNSGGSYAFPLAGIKVKLTNQMNNVVLEEQSDATGLAIFNSVSSGSYNIDASITISKADYESITGLLLQTDEVTFNASKAGQVLNTTTNNTIEMKLEFGVIGDWVIKQIYYAGSHTTNGASFRDQFIEIYNNSNKVLYADSLYIAQLFGSNTVSPDQSTGNFINDGGLLQGQWDWSKSYGNTAGADAATKYVYPRTIFRIPGTGTQYPVQPGEGIVLAATAVNHKAPYTNAGGVSVNINDPSLTVDLSAANFEFYLRDAIPNPLDSDVDNPGVPNLVVVDRIVNRDLILDNPGREAIIIFKSKANLTTEFSRLATPNYKTAADTVGRDRYLQLPNSVIIDAVQIQHATPASRVPRRLVGSLDAGAYNVPAGQYSSQSMIRKTATTVGGRKVLRDTNNSTEDFDYFDRAAPGQFK
ncbi:MAG: DUF4876 domain-containing protein [Sphingobacteriales bacterium]|nr:DUF4876 domain-containing protein [Sphingobacteriales bacterium]